MVYAGIVSEVATRVIRALTMFEDQYGVLDGLGIEEVSKRVTTESNANINNIVLFNRSSLSGDKEEKNGSKVAWRIAVPVAVGIVSALCLAVVVKLFGK